MKQTETLKLVRAKLEWALKGEGTIDITHRVRQVISYIEGLGDALEVEDTSETKKD